MIRKLLKWLGWSLVPLFLLIACAPKFFHQNKGESFSHGTPGGGRLEHPYLLEFRLPNASYFSLSSYYLLGNGYLNSRVYRTLKEAYAECEETCPNILFKYMECCDKDGGKQLIHRTHQNGLSVDFMVPKRKGNEQVRFYDHLGIWHYFLEFSSDGKLSLNSKVEIDFETMAKHILALDNAAQRNGLRIKKVLLQIDLKDDFYKTPSGKEVRRRGIYFARYLSPTVDKFHDDHYHIDFSPI